MNGIYRQQFATWMSIGIVVGVILGVEHDKMLGGILFGMSAGYIIYVAKSHHFDW